MKKSGYYLGAAAGLSFLLMSAASHAFLIPTVDFSAIAEGVKSNLELVKQSKIVVEGTALIGDVNSTIGNIKSNISDLGVEEAKRLAEKVQKQKENLEKAKEKYDKYKEKLDEAKEQVEKAKELKEKAQSKISEAQSKVSSAVSNVQEKVDDAKEKIDDAKEKVNDVKSKVDEAKSVVNDAQDLIGEAQGSVSGALGKVNSTREQFGLGGSSSESETMPSYVSTDFSSPETSTADSGSPADLMSAQAEIARLSAELELLKQKQGLSSETQMSPEETPPANNETEDETYESLDEALGEIERLQAELEKYKSAEPAGQNLQPVVVSPSVSSSEISTQSVQMPADTATPAETDSSLSSPEQTLTPAKNITPSTSSGGFRKRPTVSKDILGSLAQPENDIHVAVYSHNEVLSFAQLDMESIPTGTNSATDEFIISDEMAQYCNININETDSEAIKNCLEDIIRYRNDPDMTIAEKGEILYKNLMKETATGLTTEAIMRKNEATNYKDQVLSELNNDLGSASDIRDDIAALAQTNNQIQVLLNDLIKIQASRIMQNGMESLQDIKPTDIESGDSEEE